MEGKAADVGAGRLHLTKVAVGCSSVEDLRGWSAEDGGTGEVTIHTRYRPKRDAELIGGSLYWILAHRLAARQTILGFTDAPDGRRTLIRLESKVVLVRAQPKRAHQGWRYLTDEDAPADLSDAVGLDGLPTHLADELAALALL